MKVFVQLIIVGIVFFLNYLVGNYLVFSFLLGFMIIGRFSAWVFDYQVNGENVLWLILPTLAIVASLFYFLPANAIRVNLSLCFFSIQLGYLYFCPPKLWDVNGKKFSEEMSLLVAKIQKTNLSSASKQLIFYMLKYTENFSSGIIVEFEDNLNLKTKEILLDFYLLNSKRRGINVDNIFIDIGSKLKAGSSFYPKPRVWLAEGEKMAKITLNFSEISSQI